MRSQHFNATTSLVDFGVRAVQTPTAQTFLVLIYPIGAGEQSGGFGWLYDRSASAGQGPRLIVWDNTAAPLVEFSADSATTDTKPTRQSAANSIIYKQWQHVGVTWDGSVTAANIHIYFGQQGKPLAETASYLTTTNGAGAIVNGSANSVTIGNSTNGAGTFNGDIAYFAQWNRVLKFTELLRAQKFGPLAVPGGLILFWDGECDLGPYTMQSTKLALTPGKTIPPQFRPVPRRPVYWRVKAAGAAFDPSFMAAMDRPWRDIVFSQPQVVASGMTPPERVPA